MARLTAFLVLFASILLISSLPSPGLAATASEIETGANETLTLFYKEVKGGRELAQKARGVLIFPSVVKAGIGLGGEYGEGVLRVGGRSVNYYSTASGSIGFQLGIQSKRMVIFFMSQEALSKFRTSEGWQVGVDGSVALVTVGAGGSIDTTKIKDPVVGFVFGQQGLMYNLTLEGTKFTRISK